MKAVLFDFWGTLFENGVYSPLRQTHELLRVRERFGEFVEKFEKALMTKETTLEEGLKAGCIALDRDPKPFVIKQLTTVWQQNQDFAKPYPETMAVIQELHKKYTLGIISNTQTGTVEQLLKKFAMNSYFKAVVLSCSTGYLKTDKELFETALKKLKAKNSEAVMVGDSIETDIKGAEKAKIKAVLLDRRNTREYPNKITTLTQLPEMLEKLE